jgi:hypothetical protein
MLDRLFLDKPKEYYPHFTNERTKSQRFKEHPSKLLSNYIVEELNVALRFSELDVINFIQ